MFGKKISNGFLTTNNFLALHRDPSNTYQQKIQPTSQQNNLLLDKRRIKQMTQINPSPSKLKA
jgi:hypothetical protein